MAKENRKIAGSVRVGNRVYIEGQENDLAAALSPEQIARLSERGTLEGFGGGAKRAAANQADPETEANDEGGAAKTAASKSGATGRAKGR